MGLKEDLGKGISKAWESFQESAEDLGDKIGELQNPLRLSKYNYAGTLGEVERYGAPKDTEEELKFTYGDNVYEVTEGDNELFSNYKVNGHAVDENKFADEIIKAGWPETPDKFEVNGHGTSYSKEQKDGITTERISANGNLYNRTTDGQKESFFAGKAGKPGELVALSETSEEEYKKQLKSDIKKGTELSKNKDIEDVDKTAAKKATGEQTVGDQLPKMKINDISKQINSAMKKAQDAGVNTIGTPAKGMDLSDLSK